MFLVERRKQADGRTPPSVRQGGIIFGEKFLFSFFESYFGEDILLLVVYIVRLKWMKFGVAFCSLLCKSYL